MTLRQVVKKMEITASKQPAVSMIVQNDVFRLNSCPDARYGVFAWTQGQHSANVAIGLNSYTFTLFYVDRLTEDKRNQIDVQSAGIETLSNVVRQLEEEGIAAESVTFNTFNQRFLDECAGVFANVTFEVPAASLCGEDYATGDYNDDFNEDFLIY